VKLASPYRRWLDTAMELAAQLSNEDRAAIFHHNAGRVYALD
jgi:predicted TIM-barrel fold metal-dependent hydrolase